MKLTPVELLKMELCERYGLQPEQIQIDAIIWNVETPELADQIKKDYEIPGKARDFLRSYKGYNIIDEEQPENSKYLTGVEYPKNEDNLLNLRVYTKNGVVKEYV